MRFTYAYEKALPGFGHFISTYQGNGNPIPSFNGEPQLMPIEETAKGKCRIPRTDAAPRKERYYARQNQMKGKIAEAFASVPIL